MAAIPAYTRTWIQALTLGTPGVRITYVSLLDVMQQYLYGVTNFLAANGLTIAFSSNSIVAGAGNNIAAPANWVRGATAATAQSWLILLDGRGGQFLVAYTGAVANSGYASYSPGALFTGTGSTARPTATDELPLTPTAGQDFVSTTASGDRIWHCVVSSDATAYRFGIVRAGAALTAIGVDPFVPAALPAGISVTPVWAWFFNNFSDIAFRSGYAIGQQGGLVRAVVAAAPLNLVCNGALFTNLNTTQGGVAVTLQGGFPYWPLQLFAQAVVTAGVPNGLLGTLVDFPITYIGAAVCGDGYGANHEWFCWGATAGTAGMLWPNPSNVAPTVT